MVVPTRCRKFLKKSKTWKDNRQNSDNKNFAKNRTSVEWYTAGYLCTKFEGFKLISRAMIAKNVFDLFLDCEVGQNDPIELR